MRRGQNPDEFVFVVKKCYYLCGCRDRNAAGLLSAATLCMCGEDLTSEC
jgi:hypothetical protein